MSDIKISELPIGAPELNSIVPVTNFATGTPTTEKLTINQIVSLSSKHSKLFYFAGGDWADTSKWFFDSALSVSAGSIPTSKDIVVLDAVSLTSVSSGSITADIIYLNNGASISLSGQGIDANKVIARDNSTISVASGSFPGSTDRCDIELYDTAVMSGCTSTIVNGNVSISDSALINSTNSGLSINGNVFIRIKPNSGGGILGDNSNQIQIDGNVDIHNNDMNNSVFSYCTVRGTSTINGAKVYSCNFNGRVDATNYSVVGSCYLYTDMTADKNTRIYNSFLLGNATINDMSYVENCGLEAGEFIFIGDSYLTGGNVLTNNGTIKISRNSYFASGTLTLNDTCKLILDSQMQQPLPSPVTINDGGSYTSVVEVYQPFDNNGLKSDSTINCGTLKLYGNSILHVSLTLGTIKKIQFFDFSSVQSPISTPNDSVLEFYHNSYVHDYLSLGTNSIVKFYDNSYMDNSGYAAGGEVYFYDKSNNNGPTAVNYVYYNNTYSESGSSGTSIGSSNNYALPNSKVIKLEPSTTSIEITGMSRNNNNREITVINTSNSYSLTFKHDSTLSDSANRIKTSNGSDLTLAPGEIANFIYDIAGYWRITSDNKVSQSSQAPAPVQLTYDPTIIIDASSGDIFDITLTGDVLFDNPINSVNGKTIRLRVSQDSTGSRVVTLGTKFNIPSSATSPLAWSTTPDKMDTLAATYHATRDKWDVVAFVPGY